MDTDIRGLHPDLAYFALGDDLQMCLKILVRAGTTWQDLNASYSQEYEGVPLEEFKDHDRLLAYFIGGLAAYQKGGR